MLITIYILAPSKPLSLIATYKTPTAVSLEWTFAVPLIYDTRYVVYYESGGRSYSISFTDSEGDKSHKMTSLPVGGIHNISLVALVDLPSPLAGPVFPGNLLLCKLHFNTSFCSCRVSSSGGIRRRIRSD